MNDWPSGTRNAPDAPWSRRKKTIWSSVWASPHSIDAPTKPTMARMNSRLRPSLAPSHAVSGVAMAAATMYDVRTHVTVSAAAPRLACMCGSATLAMVESSTVMNVASMTTQVIRIGLTGLAAAGAPARGRAAEATG